MLVTKERREKGGRYEREENRKVANFLLSNNRLLRGSPSQYLHENWPFFIPKIKLIFSLLLRDNLSKGTELQQGGL